jgi:prepilin-type N-terminal cleavage/methylation domain-containing protein
VEFVRSQKRGFTLVELLIATLCLSTTSLGILAAISFTDNQNNLSQQRLKALSIATSDMENCRAQGFSGTLVAGVVTKTLNGVGLPTPASETITTSATSDPGLFTVGVQVSWTIPNGSGAITRVVSLDTALRNNDAP